MLFQVGINLHHIRYKLYTWHNYTKSFKVAHNVFSDLDHKALDDPSCVFCDGDSQVAKTK